MPSFHDVDAWRLLHEGFAVVQRFGDGCVAGHGVQRTDGARVGEQGPQVFHRRRHQLGKGGRFEGLSLLPGVEDFPFEGFQFFGDVPFRLRERLLANPLLGDLVLVRVAHFEVVSKDVVEGHLET